MRVMMMKLSRSQLRSIIRESLKDRLRKYGKHSALNLGQVARHARFPTELPGSEGKLDALKKRAAMAANDLYYAAVPPSTHHTQEEIDELDDYTLQQLLRMGFDPDFADKMLGKNT
jgi:hypothetical protein